MKVGNAIWATILIISLFGSFFIMTMEPSNPMDLPDYAFRNSQIREAYEFARTNPLDLEGVICSCGCMTEAGAAAHGSRVHPRGLRDCFMDGDLDEGGEWDSHASSCGLCYNDALDTKRLWGEGMSKDGINDFLREKNAKLVFSKEVVY